MTCEFVLKKNGVLKCMCNNLAHGLINGEPVNVASSDCLKNPNCYYKLWRRSEKELDRLKNGGADANPKP